MAKGETDSIQYLASWNRRSRKISRSPICRSAAGGKSQEGGGGGAREEETHPYLYIKYAHTAAVHLPIPFVLNSKTLAPCLLKGKEGQERSPEDGPDGFVNEENNLCEDLMFGIE
jgi:hypothetical protein